MKYLKRVIQAFVLLVILTIAAAFVAITCYKKELAGILVDYLRTEYGLAASVEKVNISLFQNWPHASIRLENTVVSSTLNRRDTVPMFRAGSLTLSFELTRLLRKQFIVNSVALDDAEITLVKDSAEATNFKVRLKKDTVTATSKISFDIKMVSLKNVRLHFMNRQRHQDISLLFKQNILKLVHHSEGFKAYVTGGIHVDELLFKPSNGPFLKNTDAEIDLCLNVFTTAKTIFADRSSLVVIEGQRYHTGAFVELGDKKRLVLNVTTEDVDFDHALPLLNTNIRRSLSQISLDHTVSVDALVVAAIGQAQDPQFIIKVKGKQDNITIGNSKVPYKDVSFEGQVTCLAKPGREPDMSTATIFFPHISGQVYDFPFSASLLVSNLKAPVLHIRASLQIDAAKVKFRPGQDLVLAGNCMAKITYSGPLYGLNKETFLNAPMRLSAKLYFKNFNYREHAHSLLYTVNGQATVNNQDLKFGTLSLGTPGGRLLLNGISKGFTPYVFGHTNGFATTLKASTDDYDLTPMITRPVSDTGTQANNKAQKGAVTKSTQSNFAFNIALNAKKVLIRKIIATHVTGTFNYDHELLSVQNLDMTACNGALSVKGSMYRLSEIRAHIMVSNMDVRMMMEQFENFGQKAIEGKNLKGTVSADASIDTKLDNRMAVMPQSLSGRIDVKLKNGHLVNYEPIQRLSNFVFKNRDFDDVTFTEINQTFKIRGYEMQINDMEIASNILNLYVDGTYNFKGESNINLRIPWSNLKKRRENYIPKNLGKEGEDAKGLKLNYHGFPDKLKLSLGNK